MKTILTIILTAFIATGVISQCSTVGIQISSSDTSFIQLYHAGFFNIPSGGSNQCIWEVSDFSGTTIHQDTTSGNFEEQSFSPFDHMVPISDSMKATIVITNEVEGIICTINDTLYWKETEVLPGSFIGNWDVLSSNGGIEDVEISSNQNKFKRHSTKIYPTPTSDYFFIESSIEKIIYSVRDFNGHEVISKNIIYNKDLIDINELPSGIYIVLFEDENGITFNSKKLIKL